MKARGQSTIEATFAIMGVLFLIFGMVQVLRWAGMDLAERRVAHDQTMTQQLNSNETVEKQLQGDFYRSKRINAVYHGNIVKE